MVKIQIREGENCYIQICHLTYARLQGLSNLIEHFENSKVLYQRDKKYRPIIRKFEKIDDLIKTQKLGWH